MAETEGGGVCSSLRQYRPCVPYVGTAHRRTSIAQEPTREPTRESQLYRFSQIQFYSILILPLLSHSPPTLSALKL